MPSLHLHKPIFLSPFITFISPVKNAYFHQSPPIIHKFLYLLQQCSKTLMWVKSIHAQITTNSVSTHHFLASKLVMAYSDLGHLYDARQVFGQIPQPKTILCNAMINGYLRNEHFEEAIGLFKWMESCHIEIDTYTCNFVLKAFVALGDYEMGMGVIRRAVGGGMERDQFLGSSIISFLVKFGNVDEARSFFDRMRVKDVVCWNSMIGGYVQAGCFCKAFDLFLGMCRWGIMPSNVTMVSLIQACAVVRNLELGRCVHGYVLGLGMGDDIVVLTSLIDMYGKMANIEDARYIFNSMSTRNLVSWNAIISGCVQNGSIHEAFDLFRRLVVSGCGFDSSTIVSILQGCAQIADLESGKVLHGCVFRRLFDFNPILLTAVVDLYSKCGALKEAKIVFDWMNERNVITWTAMLVGLAQNGHAEDALKLFCQMQQEGVAANSVTLVSLVHSCAHLGSLKRGRSVHAYLLRHGHGLDVVIMTALIDMYCKCGKLKYSEYIFNQGSISGDIILWNSMITGYGMHGEGHQAVDIFSKMVRDGLQPNEATFIHLLTACSHSGLVEEGTTSFLNMERDYNVRPNERHYACFVDILSRAGRLEEAEALIKQMPFDPGNAIFEALLSACRTHKKIDMGIRTADKLLCLNAMNPGIYVMLSNIYAEARRWDAVDYIRGLMTKRGLKKTPGYSLIEVGSQLHTFFAGDDSLPNRPEIIEFVDNLKFELEAYGYVPDTS